MSDDRPEDAPVDGAVGDATDDTPDDATDGTNDDDELAVDPDAPGRSLFTDGDAVEPNEPA